MIGIYISLFINILCIFNISYAQNGLLDIFRSNENEDLQLTKNQTWEDNGKVEFKCQHGPEECHGNMLHACSLQHNPNHTQALLFNICMMESTDDSQGSDDAAAARCASEMNVEVYKDAIIECANGEEGVKLHKYYGEESKKANFNYVPFVLINGQEYTFKNSLMEDICAAFKNPPETCRYSSELLNG
ncbi:gamma-interferon-inducible-lysosomal thiol reductase-like isoform X3 [Plodia interpunctella]|uniref:gamma-interferon-inducible-lysosomal thiol reductase-like isoform X3 n=1 Tax=Plodia interpunctella TaxID=58824 RepID=UPI0023678162|nr:gamma-interferon-inducible-lysosomal thiol reductase-like isoform X3 [Plodia interpunctella]